MANQEVGLRINVDASSVGNIKTQLREAQAELVAMRERFGEASEEAINAARRVAEIRDEIQGAREQADLFDPGNKFKALTTAASTLASGFGAVQGAMALFGEESKQLEESLLKIQSAMALSEGLSDIADVGKALGELKIVAIDTFNKMRAAIGSTGIGLLVVALGTIVAYWDDIKAAISGVSSEQKKLNEDSAKNVKSQQEKLDAIGAQENILRLQGKSERDILQMKVKQTDELIKASEIQLQNTIATSKAQIAASQRNKDILQGILTFVSAPIAVILKGIDAIGSAVGKNFDLYNKFYGGISSFVFDPKEVKKEGDAAIKEQEKALIELKNQRAGLQLSIKEADKKSAEESAKKAEERDKLAAEKRDAADKVLDDARRSKLTEQQRAEEDIIRKFEDGKKTLQAAGIKDFTAIEEQKELELAAIRKKYKDEEDARLKKIEEERIKKEQDNLVKKTDSLLKEAESDQLNFEQRLAKIQEREALENQIIFSSQEEKTAFEKANADARVKIAEAEAKAKEDQLMRGVAMLSQVADLVGRETAAGKAAAIAGATIDTYQAAWRAFKNAQANPISILGPAYPYIAAGLAVAGGIANIRKIAAVQTPKGGGGGGGIPSGGGGITTTAPVAPALAPQVVATQVNTAAVNQMGNRAARAYVLNSDIQNDNQRNAYIDRSASIG